MFQYAFARILAERFGYSLRVEPLMLFPATHQHVSGETVFGPRINWYGNWPFDDDSRSVHRGELNEPPASKLNLCGSFQRFELFAEHRDRICGEWFRTDAVQQPRPSSDFLICLRPTSDPREGACPASDEERPIDPEDELLLADSILTNDEIRRLARSVPHDRLFISIGGNFEETRKTELADLRPIFVSEEGIRDFLLVLSFQKIAISQNASHWWAAFLSSAREIYFPPLSRGFWSHPRPPDLAHQPNYHGIDLRVDEDRFIYDW